MIFPLLRMYNIDTNANDPQITSTNLSNDAIHKPPPPKLNRTAPPMSSQIPSFPRQPNFQIMKKAQATPPVSTNIVNPVNSVGSAPDSSQNNIEPLNECPLRSNKASVQLKKQSKLHPPPSTNKRSTRKRT